jgi:hypothetical protein
MRVIFLKYTALMGEDFWYRITVAVLGFAPVLFVLLLATISRAPQLAAAFSMPPGPHREAAARLVEVRSVEQSGLDLLASSSSPFYPSRTDLQSSFRSSCNVFIFPGRGGGNGPCARA